MKGDEVVQVAEEGADGALLGERRKRDRDNRQRLLAHPHDFNTVRRRGLPYVELAGLKARRQENRVPVERDGEAVIVVRYLRVSQPGDRLANILDIFAGAGNDDIPGIREAKEGLQLLPNLRDS